MNPFLDYSQYKTFTDCELKWFERYLAQVRPKPRGGQKSDVLTLGSLVHAGLQTLRETGRPVISEEALAQHGPSPECLATANQLLLGYIQAYPQEQFTRYFCEEPLRFSLLDDIYGLAKIDSYFHLQEITPLANGLGDTFQLDPGWWVHEYKTKQASRDIGRYIKSWKTNMQPAFQMLALAARIGEPIQGVLVNVLEKPEEYQPQRTCKGCKLKNELRDWVPTGAGYRCPSCSHIQELEPYKPKGEKKGPVYYRVPVHHTPEELDYFKEEMCVVAQRMQELRDGALALRATERCIDTIWGECEYYAPHSELESAEGYTGFVTLDALQYVGEKKEGEVSEN